MNPLHHPPADKAQAWFIDMVPHSRVLGLRYVENEAGRVVFDLPWRDDLVGDPETGVIHGGAISTMIDACCGGAVLSKLDALRRIATIDLRIDYLRPAKAHRTVRCEAICYRMSRHVAFCRATAHDGDPNDPVASAAGSFMVFTEGEGGNAREGDPYAWVLPE